MTEEELFLGVTGALTAGGYRWHHVRRSDLAIQQGQSGFPDLLAVHPERGQVIVLELKSERGRVEPLQADWLDAFIACGIDARVVRPNDYQALVEELVGDRLLAWR